MTVRLPLVALGAIVLASCHLAGPQPGGAGRAAAPSPSVAPRAEPNVRVAVAVDTATVSVSSALPFDLVGPDGVIAVRADRGKTWMLRPGDDGIMATGPDGRVVAVKAPTAVWVGGKADIVVDGHRYRGSILVRRSSSGGLTVINTLTLESYLLGVLPYEIGPRPESEIEAVKAQAVAARTYAIRQLGARDSLGFDFYATVADQVYRGREAEEAVAQRAVRDTRGEILLYHGQPILAYYHSTCGGRTASIDQVWPAQAEPYLRSVSDERPDGKSAYCDISNRYNWTETWTGPALLQDLRIGLRLHDGARANAVRRIRSVEIRGRTTSGRVRTLHIETDAGTFNVHGDSIRWVLRPEPGRILNSDLFDLDVKRTDGVVASLTVRGQGWGHGVGMCQMGAIGRARAGQNYREILLHYYQGTQIVRLY
ncbi:MAG: SpoIID/LytB domain-containing protein [Gemmatimonadota bacterium]